MVSDESLPHVKSLYGYRSVGEFTADVDFFLKHFKPVTLADVLAWHKGRTALPANAFLLTFDDGFREMAEIVAPILKAKGVSAAFFVNSAFVDNRALSLHQKIALLISHLTTAPISALEEKIKKMLRETGIMGEEIVPMLKSVRYANRAVLDEAAAICDIDFKTFLARQKPYVTSDQIRSLTRDGFAIGGHSIDHPLYRDLTLEEQLHQTRESVRFVCENFGLAYRAFAFPHSDTGVSQTFFERSFSEGIIEICFGTGGLLRDSWAGHFQRFSMEKPMQPPTTTMTHQYARRLFRRVTSRDVVTHPN